QALALLERAVDPLIELLQQEEGLGRVAALEPALEGPEPAEEKPDLHPLVPHVEAGAVDPLLERGLQQLLGRDVLRVGAGVAGHVLLLRLLCPRTGVRWLQRRGVISPTPRSRAPRPIYFIEKVWGRLCRKSP